MDDTELQKRGKRIKKYFYKKYLEVNSFEAVFCLKIYAENGPFLTMPRTALMA